MSERIVLFGAGTTGRVIARDLNAKGTPALCFVDSDPTKYLLQMEGLGVFSPQEALERYPDATWVASAIVPTQWREILAEIERLGVKTLPQWGFLPQRNMPPSRDVAIELLRLVAHDNLSFRLIQDQIALRNDPEHHVQEPYSDINDIYFPDFIAKREDEVYYDLGCADGDTIKAFLTRWGKYKKIIGFEPDASNFNKAVESFMDQPDIFITPYAVADRQIALSFSATGDYSAHLNEQGNTTVPCITLDSPASFKLPPTFIKADIEGSELEALWGARHILKEHKPVLAICAYHEASHLWEIPLLIHALQPEYRLFFNRYAEGTFELVWYAVPPGRVKA